MAKFMPITSDVMPLLVLVFLLKWWVVFVNSSIAVPVSSTASINFSMEDITFHDKRQELFVQTLQDYTISVPTRVSPEGNHLTYHLHAKHGLVKRHTTDYSSSKDEDISIGQSDTKRIVSGSSSLASKYGRVNFPNDVLVDVSRDLFHYRIPVFAGRNVVVRLRQNQKLLSPSAVVEKRWNRFKNVSDSQFQLLHRHVGCHMIGSVVGDALSQVALGACDGLTGFFRTNGEHFFIEPVKGHNHSRKNAGRSDTEYEMGDSSNDQTFLQHPHIVYKRSALDARFQWKARDPFSARSCGVKDDVKRAVHQRNKWEWLKHNISRSESKQVKFNTDQSKKNRRLKRSISSEKNVELLVVVDPEMMQYYENDDIENYVLSIMNMVSTLFYDASIGNAINIVLTRLLLMKGTDDQLLITHHAEKTLRSFCEWQKSINFRDDDHPNHHDVAVLLTRRNICNRMNQPCSTLGLAQVSGMCQPHRSCSVNEDTGLSLAWTVTHELGHNFAMKHDTEQTGCISPRGQMSVMSPYLSWDLIPTLWSSCSRQSITDFLDRDWGYCLDDQPGHHNFNFPQLPPGIMYDADHQCRLQYGHGATLCGGTVDLENICSTLWCRLNNRCSTKLQPAAEGTVCGNNKWCYNGECVEIAERPHAINGEWGEWGSWTQCSRTCGGGASNSKRQCSHPAPSDGGKYCLGERKRYRICESKACPDDGISFRHMQCSEFNGIPYKGKMYEWIPVSTLDTPCQLHCKPRDAYFSVLLKDMVTDGAPCVHGTRHMCISGRCRHVGCDWEIESSAVEDRCGVCYGDGSTCTTVKHKFTETIDDGYVEATVIPRGARHIRVEEVASASNFLALRNDAGEYYLNGHWFIQWSGDYEMAGTVVHYERQGNKESFRAPGPLNEALHIMLLMQAHNPGVAYEYTVPKLNATTSRKPDFLWHYKNWTHCTLSCGGGTQLSSVVCMEKEAGLVNDHYCSLKNKPDDRLKSCNVYLCPTLWWVGPWQHCSLTCGQGGKHRRSVLCVRSLGADEQVALGDSACIHSPRPHDVEQCHSKKACPLGHRWSVGKWTKCTSSCEGGVQQRNVDCVGRNTCDPNSRPQAERTCGRSTCPGLDKSKFSNPKLGTLTLSKLTAESKIHDWPNSYLRYSSKDANSRKKSLEASKLRNDKKLSNIIASKDDTNTLLKNKLTFTKNLSNNGSTIKNRSLTVKKELNRIHFDQLLAESQWLAGDWSKCSSVCGTGVQTRSVSCFRISRMHRVNANLCSIHTKPSAIQVCGSEKCASWHVTDWGDCSATCGYAVRTRGVTCSQPGQCDPNYRPEGTHICQSQPPCVIWATGEWSKCSKSCDKGSQQRLVQCINVTSQAQSASCDKGTRPTHTRACTLFHCPSTDAAFRVRCESNEMHYDVCRVIKNMGLCERNNVREKCCRTCSDHRRHLSRRKISDFA